MLSVIGSSDLTPVIENGWMDGWMEYRQTLSFLHVLREACQCSSSPSALCLHLITSYVIALTSVYTHMLCVLFCVCSPVFLLHSVSLSVFFFFFLFTVTRAQKFQIRTGCSGSACIHYLFWCSVRLQSHNQTEQLSLFSVSQWLNLLQPRGRNLAHLA